MKFPTAATALLFAATLAAATATDRKRYIVTYDPSTADDVVEKAMQEAKLAGAEITHQFRIIKGFSADAPTERADQFITSLKNNAHVEQDSVVTTQGGPGPR